MPRPAHGLCTFSGVFGSAGAPLEQWQVGLRVSQGFDDVALASSRDLLAAGAKDAWNLNIGPHMWNDTVLTGVTLRTLGSDGLEPRDADGSFSGQGRWTGAVAGTNNGVVGAVMPWQTALVVSLSTARAGARGKGRIFLPWPGYALAQADRRLSVANATSVMDGVRNLIVDLNNAFTGDVSVVSSFGFISPVTGLRVGRVPDNHDSRRADAVEGYVTRSLAAS